MEYCTCLLAKLESVDLSKCNPEYLKGIFHNTKITVLALVVVKVICKRAWN